MAWVATAVAVGSAALGMYQQKQTEKANGVLTKQNRNAAVTAQTYENRGLNEQVRQAEEQDVETKLMARIEAMKAASTLKAQGKSVTGSTDDMQQEIFNQLGRSLGNADANKHGRRQQLEMDKKGSTSRTQSRINSMATIKTDWGTELARAGLSIGGTYANQQSLAKARGDTKSGANLQTNRPGG